MREVGGSSPSSPIVGPVGPPPAVGGLARPPSGRDLNPRLGRPFRPPRISSSTREGGPLTLSGLDVDSAVITLSDRVAGDLLTYAGSEGHPDFPCLSSSHNPSSCVPVTDFSPWLGERVRLHDVEAVGDFLWRIRQANPGRTNVARGK